MMPSCNGSSRWGQNTRRRRIMRGEPWSMMALVAAAALLMIGWIAVVLDMFGVLP